MKPVHLVAGSLVAAATLLAVPLASARPAFRSQVIEQFKLDAATTTCQYCHVNAGGGAPWNKFGDAVRANLRGDAKGNIADALYLTLKADKDSDGDGYADALEVFAKTLPGDPKSVPPEAPEALKARFEAAGGLGQYKP